MNPEDKFTAPELDLDEEGYFASYDIENCTLQDIQNCYAKYGLVVFRNIIGQEEIDRTIDELWKETIDFYGEKVVRQKPETWGHIRGWQKDYGFVSHTIIDQKQFWLNRKNPKVYQCFKKTYEASSGKQVTEPLLCSLDRGSMILPGGLNPDWKGQNFYHFDINPWAWVGGYPPKEIKQYRISYQEDQIPFLMGQGNYAPNVGYTKLAGVLALSDTNQTSGGFQAACGFQNYIQKWVVENPDFTHITKDKNLVANFRRIFMRKGSLLVFSRELPHNIYCNQSKNFRYAQYLRMSPESALDINPRLKQARKELIGKLLPKNIDFSDPISREIFMLGSNGK